VKLSIVVSTFNRAEVLELSLRSLMRTAILPDQWELIVIDDGSTDGTAAFLYRFKEEMAGKGFDNVRLFRRLLNVGKANNAGLARNCGLRKAEGDYIAFSDGDCFFMTDVIARTLAWIDNDAGRCLLTSGCWYRVTKTNGGAWYEDGPRGPNQTVPFGPWLALERQWVMAIGGFDERFTTYAAEDHDLLRRLMLHGIRRMDRDRQIIAHHLWHRPGGADKDPEQFERQLYIYEHDKSIVRNRGIEWGRLQ